MQIHECLGCGKSAKEENTVPVISVLTGQTLARVHKRAASPSKYQDPCHARALAKLQKLKIAARVHQPEIKIGRYVVQAGIPENAIYLAPRIHRCDLNLRFPASRISVPA